MFQDYDSSAAMITLHYKFALEAFYFTTIYNASVELIHSREFCLHTWPRISQAWSHITPYRNIYNIIEAFYTPPRAPLKLEEKPGCIMDYSYRRVCKHAKRRLREDNVVLGASCAFILDLRTDRFAIGCRTSHKYRTLRSSTIKATHGCWLRSTCRKVGYRRGSRVHFWG